MCPALSLPNGNLTYNSHTRYEGYFYPSTEVTAVCGDEYFLNGSSVRTCMFGRYWDGDVATCIR